MSDLLDSWLKAREEESFFERLSATGLQAMKDYLYGDITPADAAIKYTANFNIQGLHDTSLDIHLHYLLIPAIQISSFDIQGKLVKLLAAIRDLRSKSWKASQSIFPKHISALQYVLPNFEFNLVDEFVGRLPTILPLGTISSLLMLIQRFRPFGPCLRGRPILC